MDRTAACNREFVRNNWRELKSFTVLRVNEWKILKIMDAYDLLRLQDYHTFTALICAAENGNTECVSLLIQGGADTDVRDCVRALDALRVMLSASHSRSF